MALSALQIEAIRERIDIVRVIGAYVTLKKKGQRYLGLCPFHGEKTPSFSVSPDKGLYYCFGCHAGGDAFSFLMRHRGVDFSESARLLAAETGVVVTVESEAEKKRKRELAELARVNAFAQAFFAHALWQKAGKPGRDYLAKRGIPEDFARERALGFCPDTATFFAYLEAKKVPQALAQKAGLLTDDGKRLLFDGRVIFPIFDSGKRLAGFGGRRLGDGNAPKYINTRETPLFSKRRLLYGWDTAEEAIRRAGKVLVVEGYMDVLACHRAGLAHAVAALGTAFTDDHAHQCARLCREAVLLFDGDAAGQNASHEAAAKVLGCGLKTMVVGLPPGKDPDSLLTEQGPDALLALVQTASPALEHFIATAFADPALSVEDRAERARSLAPLLFALPMGLERDLYTARLADKVGVAVDKLKEHLKRLEPKKPKPTEAEPAAAKSQTQEAASALAPEVVRPAAPDKFEQAALKELLLHPELRTRLGDLAEFCSDPMRLLLEELAGSQLPVAEVLAHHLFDPQQLARLADVKPYELEANEEVATRANRTFAEVLRRLKRRQLDVALQETRAERESAVSRGEDTAEYDDRVRNLTRKKQELKRVAPSAT